MRTSEVSAILRQLFLLLVSVAVLYAAVLVLSFLLLPPPGASQPIDTLHADDTIYMTPAKEIYYGRQSLREPGKKVILLGSSNTQVGFSQIKLQSMLPGYTVHNMGIGDNNITEARQIARLAMSTMSDADIRNSVFVIGAWYGMFVENASRWDSDKSGRFETDIDHERFRYGFWKRGADGPVELISDRNADRAALLVHPLIALEEGARLVTADLRSLAFIRPPRIDEKVRDTIVYTADQRARQPAYRRSYMKTEHLSDEQYGELATFVREVAARGAEVIVADLPIPEWHAKALPYDAQHRQKMARFVAANAALPRFSYLDLRGLNDDDRFYDDAHVRPRAQGPWLIAMRDRIMKIASGTAVVASN